MHDLSDIKIFLPALSVVILLIILLFMVAKTRSSQILLYKIWRFMFGEDRINHQPLQQYAQDSFDVDYFRFMFNLNVGNLHDIDQVIEFAKKYNISHSLLKSASRYLNLPLYLALEKPKMWIKAILLICFITSAFALLAGAHLILTNTTLVSTKPSHHVYWISENNIYTFNGRKIMSYDECDSNKAQAKSEAKAQPTQSKNDNSNKDGFLTNIIDQSTTSNLSKTDLEINQDLAMLCTTSKHKDFKSDFTQELKLQRFTGFIILLIGLIGLLESLLSLLSWNSANTIWNQVKAIKNNELPPATNATDELV